MAQAPDRPTRFTRVARVAAAVLVLTLPLLTSTVLPLTATAAPLPVAGTSAATGFDPELSFTVDPDPPVLVTDDVGSVTAPPDSSVNLPAAETSISIDLVGVIGVLPIAQAMASTPPPSAVPAAQPRNPPSPVPASPWTTTFSASPRPARRWTAPSARSRQATTTVPTSFSLNGTQTDLDLDGETVVTLTNGSATITTPPTVSTDSTADAVALTVSISVTTANYTETGILTLASSSCVTPAAPTLESLNPRVRTGVRRQQRHHHRNRFRAQPDHGEHRLGAGTERVRQLGRHLVDLHRAGRDGRHRASLGDHTGRYQQSAALRLPGLDHHVRVPAGRRHRGATARRLRDVASGGQLGQQPDRLGERRRQLVVPVQLARSLRHRLLRANRQQLQRRDGRRPTCRPGTWASR